MQRTVRPPANRVAQMEHQARQSSLSGSVIIVTLALGCVLVALVIVLEILVSMPAL